MRVRNSCIVNTTYTLALYLLYMSMEEIQRTRFFVGPAVIDRIASRLPVVYKFDTKDQFGRVRFWGLLKFRIKTILIHLFYILPTKVYGLDHLPFFEMILGFKKYILLEDAPEIFTRCLEVRIVSPRTAPMTVKGYICHWLRFGVLTGRRFGSNGQCVNRILTDPKDVSSPILRGRKYELVDLKGLWAKASEVKRSFIREVFGIETDIMKSVEGCSTLFFTQPYYDDLKLTTEEWMSVLDPVLKQSGVAIKIHPRDTFDYAKYYPNVPILNCAAPMQLLCLDPVPFKKAITINSTAVSAMPDCVEKVVLGAGVHPKILAACS